MIKFKLNYNSCLSAAPIVYQKLEHFWLNFQKLDSAITNYTRYMKEQIGLEAVLVFDLHKTYKNQHSAQKTNVIVNENELRLELGTLKMPLLLLLMPSSFWRSPCQRANFVQLLLSYQSRITWRKQSDSTLNYPLNLYQASPRGDFRRIFTRLPRHRLFFTRQDFWV